MADPLLAHDIQMFATLCLRVVVVITKLAKTALVASLNHTLLPVALHCVTLVA